ncbi:MAG: hypothetical protein ACJAWV_002263 [Flammeovirgaceae bacterium]|jgi:hypothetical protein
MDTKTKKYYSIEEFKIAEKALSEYQLLHNQLRKDFENLIELTERNKNNLSDYDTLYRACVRSVLTIIEADLYGLNQLDPYRGYSDYDSFEAKFKKTFKQICITWKKNDIIPYLNEKYERLRLLKTKRNELIHPKSREHFHNASDDSLEDVKVVFKEYSDLINSIMDNFFISIEV